MRLLVLGANGLVGSNLVTAARERGHDVVGTYHSERPSFDVPLERHDVRDDLTGTLDPSGFDAVVNCAAMTDVDGCESDRETAMAVNAHAPGRIAAACAAARTRFVHFSTDYVFDGDATEPYDESASVDPIQVYGESKLAGERAVREADGDPLVLRLSFVYGIHRGRDELAGFPAWVVGELREGSSVQLFTDQHVSPSRAGAVATTTLDLLAADRGGCYHVAVRSCVTPYAFGERLAEHVGASPDLIEAGSRSALDRPAPRPAYSCLSTDRVERALDRPQPKLAEDLAAIGDRLR